MKFFTCTRTRTAQHQQTRAAALTGIVLHGIEQTGEVHVHGGVHVLHQARLHKFEHQNLRLELMAVALVEHVC